MTDSEYFLNILKKRLKNELIRHRDGLDIPSLRKQLSQIDKTNYDDEDSDSGISYWDFMRVSGVEETSSVSVIAEFIILDMAFQGKDANSFSMKALRAISENFREKDKSILDKLKSGDFGLKEEINVDDIMDYGKK